MGVFNIFKSKWSAVYMTNVDREKIFWYLKRKTSYTAWAREVEIFDRFADVFAKQVKEQPHAPGSMGGTDWGPFYSKVLKAQVFYEKSMERLLTGDRTIFLYNGRGILVDATDLSEYWYTELVNQGMRGDHTYDGKYVPQMTALMHEFFEATQSRGYLQPMMAETPAPELWSKLWYDDYARLCIPDNVDDIPSETNILIRTGQEVPVFGIYEPQIKDGCMNYLLAGTDAPTVWESDGELATGNTIAVTWRLIWEDTRYVDGTIPAEERLYFKRVQPAANPPLAPDYVDDTLGALTGELCVRAGTWAVIDDMIGKIEMAEHAKFPQYMGRDTMWVWVAK